MDEKILDRELNTALAFLLFLGWMDIEACEPIVLLPCVSIHGVAVIYPLPPPA
jgi:hypothetical protein